MNGHVIYRTFIKSRCMVRSFKCFHFGFSCVFFLFFCLLRDTTIVIKCWASAKGLMVESAWPIEKKRERKKSMNENKESGNFSFVQFIKSWENCRRHKRHDDVSCGHGPILLLSALCLSVCFNSRSSRTNQF